MYTFEAADNLDIKEVFDLYSRYSNQELPNIYGKFSFGREIFPRASGAYLYTRDGKEIFDFTGGLGVANMGHNHPRIAKVRKAFLERGYTEIHKNYLNRFLAALSANLAEILPGNLNYSFFCNSGAEAVEGALKIAYKYHGAIRNFVLRSDRSFHGKTLGAGSLSYGDNFVAGNARFSFQKIPGVLTYNFNDPDSVRALVEEVNGSVYAIFVEPFSCSTLTESGERFLKEVRKLCDEREILLVFDEIYSGFAKCGPNFYMEKYGVIPDIVCLSKSLGGGKSSISAYVSTDEVYRTAYGTVAGALMHSTTYNSFGEECATALEAINILAEERLSERALNLEKLLRDRLGALVQKYPSQLKEWRGAGTHFGVIFQPKFEFLQPLLQFVPITFVQDPNFLRKVIVTAAIEEYYDRAQTICAFTSNQDVILNFSPPPVADPDEVDRRLQKFGEVLETGVGICAANFLKKNFTR
jgi:putrescine aminotransferase